MSKADLPPGFEGPSRGFSGINDHLKNYFRKKGDRNQQRMDEAYTRSLGKKPKAVMLCSVTGRFRSKVTGRFVKSVN